MIEFKNEKQLKEWLVDLENHVDLLKANIRCEKRQCTIVENSTAGFVFKSKILEHAEAVKNCASMIKQYTEPA